MTSIITPYRSLVRTVAPSVEPVSVAEAKVHCRIDASDEDAYIGTLITAAREYVEDVLDISTITQEWTAKYNGFPSREIVLPRPPAQPETVTISYTSEGGSTVNIVSVTDFRLDASIVPAQLYPLYLEQWPLARDDFNTVSVEWTAGYGDAATDVPAGIKHLIKLLVAHWFEMRQPVSAGFANVVKVPHTLETLLMSSGYGRYA